MRDLIPRWVLGQLRSSCARSLLTVLGVSLATALVVSVHLAHRAALSSFRDSAERVAGRTSFSLVSDGPSFDETILPDLSWTRAWGGMFPRVEGRLSRPENPSEALVLLGLDLLKDRDARDLEILGPGGRVLSRDERFSALARVDAVYLSERYAKKSGLEAGKEALFTALGRPVTLHVAGLMSGTGVGGAYGGRVAVMDLGAAQHLLGLNGRLNHLDFVVSPDADAKSPPHLNDPRNSQGEWSKSFSPCGSHNEKWLAARLKKEMPPGLRWEDPRAAVDRTERMLRPMGLHLFVLSLLSLLAAAFLVNRALSISVLRRVGELGTLRTLGLTAAGLRGLLMAEAACLTFAGTLLGLLLGRLGAWGVARMVIATWTRLYLSVPVAPTLPSRSGEWAVAFSAFLFVTLCAWPVAWGSSRITPGLSVRPGGGEGSFSKPMKGWALGSGLLLCLAAALVRLPPLGGFPWGAYAGTLCLLTGAAVLAPFFFLGVIRMGKPLFSRGLPVEAHLASRRLQSGISRGSLAVGILAAGVGLLVSTILLAGSFRSTLVDSVEATLRADLLVQSGSPQGRLEAVLDPSAVEAVKALPGVAAVDASLAFASLAGEKAIRIRASDTKVLAEHGRLVFSEGGDSSRILAELPGRLSAVCSEPLARRFLLKAGDFFTLHTPSGWVPLEIRGVYEDAADAQGTLLMDRGTYRSLYRDPAVNELSIYASPDVAPGTLRRMVQQSGGSAGGWVVRSRSEMRERFLGNSGPCFVLTAALGSFALLLAVMGVFAALTALRLESPSGVALLRYLGAAPSQVKGMVLWEAGLLGAFGCVMGSVVGWILSWILVHVVAAQTFGWTLRFLSPYKLVAGALLLLWVFTLLAGFIPAGAASRIPSLRAMNRE